MKSVTLGMLFVFFALVAAPALAADYYRARIEGFTLENGHGTRYTEGAVEYEGKGTHGVNKASDDARASMKLRDLRYLNSLNAMGRPAYAPIRPAPRVHSHTHTHTVIAPVYPVYPPVVRPSYCLWPSSCWCPYCRH